MIYKNKILEAKLILGTGLPNQTHLTYCNVVAVFLAFVAVADTTDIV